MENEYKNLIHLVENYYFTADSHQFILMECGVRKKIDIKTKQATDEDKNYQNILGYYNTLSSLLKGCVSYDIKNKINTKDITTLSDCLNRIEYMTNKILEITKGM